MPKNTRSSIPAVALIVLSACGSSRKAPPPATIVADYRLYNTVKELRANSDSVLLGTFGNKTGSQLDNGGNPADIGGIPMTLYEFRVSRVLSGRDPGPKVEVLAIDNLSPADDASLRPVSGEEVVIFAQVLSATTAPRLKLSGPTINAVSGNNGVFDVANGRARARLNIASIDDPVLAPSSLPPAGLSPLLDISLAELEVAANQP